ncbi:retroviral-like aspartic protease family protein [Rheinheimera faecalis]|uniref:retroviral-like aspartic protease family protein n=1 Tax=Rheinheimera faecalis TaxID=2901141 RepID=UPI001E38875F|nr:aspartyl protease family protein [Rheinheimera faecalis]
MLYQLFFLFAILASSCSVFASPMDKDGWLPFELQGGIVTIDVEFEGKTRKAIIDSGAEINSISAGYVELKKNELQFGEKIRLKGVFGEETTALVNAIPVKIFGHEVELNDLAPAQLGNAILLLGLPFLQNFIVQFDYPNQKMRLLPHSVVDMKKIANVEVKKSRNRNLPAIKVELAGGKSLWLTLDTGNSGGLVVSRMLAEEQDWLRDQLVLKHSVSGAVKSGQVETFTISYLKVGPYELENVLVTIPVDGEAMNIRDSHRSSVNQLSKGTSTNGLLGYDILKHFVLTLDTKNWRAHLAAP